MKKLFYLFPFIFLLVTFSTKVLSAPIKNPLGVDLAGQNGPNPAPPIGLTPCGKTMCNKDETCTKYPQDEDEHCVPNKLLPKLPNVPPQDLPEGIDMCAGGQGVYPPNEACTNNFKNTQIDVSKYQKTCIYEPVVLFDGDREPDGPIWPSQPYTKCGNTDEAGPGPNAPEPPIGGPDKYDCAVNMLVYTDVRDAEIGGYGPTSEVRQEKGTDFTAQNYLYSALFDKPLDLTKPTSFGTKSTDNPLNNREASRTYWRLMSAHTQANLRSYTLNMANEGQSTNVFYTYTDTNGKVANMNLKELYKMLKSQIILFLHWPFVRVGCLTDYPVCPEFAQAIKDLKPPTENITNYLDQIAAQIPNGSAILSTTPVGIYESFLKAHGFDLDGPYSAFVPLEHDSIRSYVLKKRDEDEYQMYIASQNVKKLVNVPNMGRYGTDKPQLTNVSRENIPYLGAIHQGLLSPKFGLMSAIQPSWLFDVATNSGLYSDYNLFDFEDPDQAKNQPQDFPEVKIARQNWLSFLQEQVGKSPTELVTDAAFWVYDQVKSFFMSESCSDKTEKCTGEYQGLKGYTKIGDDLKLDEIRTAYLDYKKCPLPVSYHLLSPKTNPQDSPIPPGDQAYSDHHQVISIWGPELEWSWNPIREKIEPDPITGICSPCSSTIDHFPDEGGDDCTCWRRHWTVTGTKHGKALTVLNNPKATDVKNAIVQSDFSLYKTLIPDAANKKKITDASIDAPYAANYHAFQSNPGSISVAAPTPAPPGSSTSGPIAALTPFSPGKCKFIPGTSTSPNGKSCVLNEVEPINRINNRAQDTMHLLQNCWTVPDQLQNSPRCKLALVDQKAEEVKKFCKDKNVPDTEVDSKFLGTFRTNFIDLAEKWTTSCPGQENNLAEECYNYVASESKKAGVNPAFALTIWLNESGASNYCYGGETTQDMGINLPDIYQNLEEQVKVFTNMANMKLCESTPGPYVENMHRWLSRYQSHDGACNPLDTVATQYYYDVMATTWDFVSGCTQNGTRGGTRFGIDWPTDMSCP